MKSQDYISTGAGLYTREQTPDNHKLIERIRRVGGEIAVGDLLESIKDEAGADSMTAALCELWRMNEAGRVMIMDDTETMRITVQLHENQGEL